MELDKLLDELIILLENNPNIKKIQKIKKKIGKETLDLINEYRLNPSVSNKKKLYHDEVFLEYLECENEINYLIMAINQKFRVSRGKCCESNKW